MYLNQSQKWEVLNKSVFIFTGKNDPVSKHQVELTTLENNALFDSMN